MTPILTSVVLTICFFTISYSIFRIFNKGLSHKSLLQQFIRFLVASIAVEVPFVLGNLTLSSDIVVVLCVSLLWIATHNILYDKTYKKSSPDYDNHMDIAFGIYLFGWLSSLSLLLSPLGWAGVAVMSIIEIVLALVPLLQIGYFFMYNTCLDNNGMQVIMETNYNEIIEYAKSFNALKLTTIVSLILLIVASITIGNCFAIGCYTYLWDFSTFLSISKLLAIAVYFVFLTSYLWKKGDVWAKSHGLFVRTGIAMLHKDVREYMEGNKIYKQNVAERMSSLIADAKRNKLPKPHTIVMVIGESACRDYMSVYCPQDRETTPWQSAMSNDKEHFYLFQNAYSCGIQTVPSLEKALTEYNQYNDKSFVSSYSIVDMAHKAGYRVHWYSNQGHLGSADTPVSLVAETSDVAKWTNQTLGKMQYDEALLDFLGEVDGSVNNLLVLHLKGNHFNFTNRYTPEFAAKHHLPDGDDVTTYRNSILYNDHILHSFYDYASERLNLAAMVYFSDHGAIPDKQRSILFQNFGMSRIPLWIYLTDTYIKARPDVRQALDANRNKYFTNDLAYELMCELMGITSEHYQPYNSIASTSYNYTREMLTTCDGRIKIANDKTDVGEKAYAQRRDDSK